MSTAIAGSEAIVKEIEIRASAERIFQALTEPEELLQWWGTEGKFQTTHVELDLRLGGRWKMRLVGCGGTETTVAGEFIRIERPILLIFSWIREDDGIETFVRWDLKERDGVTNVRVTHSGLTSESLRIRNDGWPLILGLLQSYVEG